MGSELRAGEAAAPAVPVTQPLVILLQDHVAHATASRNGRVIEAVTALRPLTKVRTVLPVMGLVKGKELLLQIQGGMNWPLGDAWTFNGPTLLGMFALYKPTTSAQAVAKMNSVARFGKYSPDLERAA